MSLNSSSGLHACVDGIDFDNNSASTTSLDVNALSEARRFPAPPLDNV